MEPPLTPPGSPQQGKQGASVFFSYAHRDKGFRDRLEEHLSNLKYRGLITTWYDRDISAGEEWAKEIEIHLNQAQVILLLISASFMASDYCYSIEMRQALERYERHEADVLPILLRPVLYTDAPFAKLQMLPSNGKPVVLWRNLDSAFVDVAYAIERVAQKYLQPAGTTPTQPEEHTSYGSVPTVGAGSQVQPPQFSNNIAPPTRQTAPQARSRNLTPLLVGMVGLVICILSSTSLVLFYSARNEPIVNPTATTSIPTPTPTPTPPNPASNPAFIIVISIILLIGIIVAIIAIRAVRAKREQRRMQTFENARKREYYEQAIEAYRGALERNPHDADALRGMGNALCALGEYDQALDAFTRAIDCGATPAAYAGLGDVFAKLKRYSEAVDAYKKAIELDPTVTLNFADYTQALQALGRKEEAERVRARTRQLGYEDLR